MTQFEKSMDVLVKAYFNDTLEDKNCQACAVGNLVCSAMGYKYHCSEMGLLDTGKRMNWFAGLYRDPIYDFDANNLEKELDAIGYSLDEVRKIEKSFEQGAAYGDIFAGLMAVLEVLAEIHGVDLTAKESFASQLLEIHQTK